MFRKRILFGAAGALGAIIATAGIALAVWTVTGSGQGGAAATVSKSLIITPTLPANPSIQPIYPGGPAGPVFYLVSNPNPFAITVTGISYGTPVSNNATTCPSSNVSIDASAPTTFSTPVAANASNWAFAIPGVLDMSHSAPDGCQGVTFTVPITLTAAQQ